MEQNCFRYENGSKFTLKFVVESQESIANFTYNITGFTLKEAPYENAGAIYIILKHETGEERGKVALNIILCSGMQLTPMAYGVSTVDGLFISPYSYDNALQRSLDYCENGIVSPTGYETLQVEDREVPIRNKQPISLLSAGVYIVQGQFLWEDDFGDIRPLKNIRVLIMDNGNTLGTVYTDIQGNFVYQLTSYVSKIHIRVYPQGQSISVCQENLSAYVWRSEEQNVVDGVPIIYSKTFTMKNDAGEDDLLGQAFQIHQAAIVGSKFIEAYKGSSIRSCTIRYPYTATNYDRTTMRVNIAKDAPISGYPESYASWDVILHEYAHYIQDYYDINASPGGWHTININMADHYRSHHSSSGPTVACSCKTTIPIEECYNAGMKLAWAEGWATTFSIIAQKYYFPDGSDIATVGDDEYRSDNTVVYNLENNFSGRALGDACEGTVMQILYDIYDDSGTAESHDKISISALTWLELSIESQATTLYDFLNYLKSNHLNYISDIGSLLAYGGIAPKDLASINVLTVENAPGFSFTYNNPSIYYNSMLYSLIFYDESKQPVYQTAWYQSRTILLTSSEWIKIRQAYGTFFYVTVRCRTNSTSDYESTWIKFEKPHTADSVDTITIFNSFRYKEEYFELYQGQSIEYTVIIEESKYYAIQTFGGLDTRIYIYNSTGGQLYYNDDGGYKLNAYICKYLPAATYKIKINLFQQKIYGKIKLSFTPVKEEISFLEPGEEKAAMDAFLNIEPYYSHVLQFIPNLKRTYKVYTYNTSPNSVPYVDTYVYLIDPRTADPCLSDDDSGGNLQGKVVASLDKGVTYWGVFAGFDNNQSGRVRAAFYIN